MIREPINSILIKSHKILLLVALAIGASISESVTASELSPREMNFWVKVHQIHNPGVKIIWPKGGPRAWARTNAESIDPIVAEIIRGDGELPWFHALFAARIATGAETRNALFDRLSQSFNDAIVLDGIASRDECSRLTGIAKILAKDGDQRTVPIINALLRGGSCDDVAKKRLIVAVSAFDNESTRLVLKQIKGQKNVETVDRAAAFAEKIIEARIAGKSFPPETAHDDLRIVTLRFLRACETANLQTYSACFPWGFDKIIDEGDMHEFLDGEHGKPALDAIRAALGADTPFKIDRETLQAKLVCDGHYSFEYIYEVDGWKIMKIMPPVPVRSHNNKPLQTSPMKEGVKRTIIGEPAKD